jgi:hypothetical protein
LATIQNISKFRPNIRFYTENQATASSKIIQKSSPIQYQGQNHYYDENHKAIASIKMLNGQSVNCASVSIESIGSGLNYPAWLSGEAISQKSFFVDIQSTGMYEVTLYFNENELVAWPELDDLSIIKTPNPVSSSSQYSDVYFGEDLLHFELPNGVHAFRFNSMGDGGYTLSSFNSQTVPVELLSFSVESKKKSNMLNWIVANEIGIDAYFIERSFDGRHFEELSVLKAKESSDHVKSYVFEDVDLWVKDKYYFYRLKVVEENGIERYSTVESLFVKGSSEIKLIAFPNPFWKEIRIAVDLSAADSIQRIVIHNMEGNIVNIIEPSDYSAEYQLDMENNPPGMYILSVFTEKGSVITKRISLVK